MEMLVGMGFQNKHAEKALKECGGSIERAADWLFSRMVGVSQKSPVKSPMKEPGESSCSIERAADGLLPRARRCGREPYKRANAPLTLAPAAGLARRHG